MPIDVCRIDLTGPLLGEPERRRCEQVYDCRKRAVIRVTIDGGFGGTLTHAYLCRDHAQSQATAIAERLAMHDERKRSRRAR